MAASINLLQLRCLFLTKKKINVNFFFSCAAFSCIYGALFILLYPAFLFVQLILFIYLNSLIIYTSFSSYMFKILHKFMGKHASIYEKSDFSLKKNACLSDQCTTSTSVVQNVWRVM